MSTEDYRFLYHKNTYSGDWGAMTVDSVGFYFNGENKGNWVKAKTRNEARDLLKEKLNG